METIADTVYHLPEIVGGPTILVGDALVVVVIRQLLRARHPTG